MASVRLIGLVDSTWITDFCSRFAHQKGVDLVCDFFSVSDSRYEVGGAGGIISS